MAQNIVYINSKTIEQVKAILKKFFGQSYYGADDRFMQWFYFDSPFKTQMVKEDEYSILAFVDENENVLALDAFLPWQTMVNGKEVLTIWDIEWLNCSSIKGLGREIVKNLRGRTEIYCGYGMNSLSKSAFGKIGFPMKDEIERKIAVLNVEKCVELFTKTEDQSEFIKNHFSGSSKCEKSEFVELNKEHKLSTKYWLDHLVRCPITSFKDPAAIEWRYLKHPYIDYHLIAPASGVIVVLR